MSQSLIQRAWHAPFLLLTLTALFWSGNWIIGRATVGEVPPIALAWWRWVLAVLFMLPLALPQIRASWPAIRRDWKKLAGLGILGMGYHNMFSYLGLQYTTATNGVMLNSAIPVFIMILGVLFFGQKLRWLQVTGVVISLAGVIAILSRGDLAVLARLQLNVGDIILLASMVQWAFYTLALKWKPADVPPLAFLCVCATVGVIAMTPAYLVAMALGSEIKWSWPVVGALVYVSFVPSFIGYIFWNRGVELAGAEVAGMFIHLMPVFGSMLAWLFLSERLYGFHLLGIALILTGIFVASRRESTKPPAPAAPAD
ncbi:MAG: DMT family transporter [Betaproteobacteria bacterium]|nr:DMT family transporter [Betaproteobacteria bacterium]